ncbi:GHMP kinase [Acidianus sp. DSM 29099]|nr:GHMP kinase [Acidianus sp. RZ1]
MVTSIFVPISISGIWYPVLSKNPIESGSIGIGLVLDPYIEAKVIRGDPEIILNGEKIYFPNVYILKTLGGVKVEISTNIPLGYGYGMSAALSLAYALGASNLYNVKEEKAIRTAHISEVINGNGLGDIEAEYIGGGLIYREVPGFPGKIRKIDVEFNRQQICSKPIERMETKGIIKNNPKALQYIDEFLSNPSIENFFNQARKFTEDLGMFSPYPNSFRKKGLIIRMGECKSQGWIVHNLAKIGAHQE